MVISMKKIDLNCDLGESFGAYTIGCDSKVIPLITSANVACGFHAGDPAIMSETVHLAAKNGTAVGAHPGFPDLQGFGRRKLDASPEEVKSYILYQIGALDGFCRVNGIKMQHVKPHGALYNMAAADEKLAAAICEAIKEFDPELILMGLSGSKMETAAADFGIPFASEVFADRGYRDDGSLVPRKEPGAVITDEELAVKRVVQMAKEGTVETVSGKTIKIKADSVCVHGDNAHALLFVERIKKALEENGIEVSSLK